MEHVANLRPQTLQGQPVTKHEATNMRITQNNKDDIFSASAHSPVADRVPPLFFSTFFRFLHSFSFFISFLFFAYMLSIRWIYIHIYYIYKLSYHIDIII